MRHLAAIVLGLGFVVSCGCSAPSPSAERGAASADPRGAPPGTTAPPRSIPQGAPETTSTAAASPGDPSFEAVLAPLHDVELFARLDGVVEAVDVEEGRRVAAGTRLAQIDDRDRRATLEEREAEAARAAGAWDRAQRLHEQKVIADEPFNNARSEWQAAVARRDRAKVEWERCSVRSPIGGIVALRRVQVGQMVKEDDLLFRVSDPDRLRAELLMPESRFGTVRAGQTVRLVPAAGGAPTMARISHVSSLVDPASGTFRVLIDVDNRRGKLPAGISTRVEFDTSAAR